MELCAKGHITQFRMITTYHAETSNIECAYARPVRACTNYSIRCVSQELA